MTTPINVSKRSAFSNFLRIELELSSTRWRSMFRIASCTALVVAIAMTFQIPLPAYLAYLVFVTSQEDAASTLVTAAGGAIAATLAVSVSMLLYIFDASAPALRIPLLALSAFAGSFLSRTSVLGPIAFLSGYILVLSQTLIDDSPTTEPLTHSLLWLWIVIMLPIAITVLVNLLLGESPVALSRKRATDLFGRMASYLESPFADNPQRLRDELLALGQLKNKAFLWDKKLKAFAQEDGRIIAILLEIQTIALSLPTTVSVYVRRSFGASLREAGEQFLRRRTSPLTQAPVATYSAEVTSDQAACIALHMALKDLHEETAGHHPKDVAPKKAARSFLIPDAFSNRSHARFAIKVMIAALASYATYTLLDWPGIRTAVTTCFFVSLTTFGEGIHKFTLRASGAIIGGLLAGLCIVFVIPLLTDIGQLCALIAAVSMFAAWIGTSSEAISYAGLQIAFAFFLGVLQSYGPATDLTVLRDRIVGILIGNVWVTVVFASVWPVSAMNQARTVRDAVLGKLGRLLKKEGGSPLLEKMAICQDLSHAALLRARSAFEWRRLGASDIHAPKTHAVERLTSLTFILIRLRDVNASTATQDNEDALIATQLMALSENKGYPPIAAPHDITAPPALQQARRQLEEEIGDASRSI